MAHHVCFVRTGRLRAGRTRTGLACCARTTPERVAISVCPTPRHGETDGFHECPEMLEAVSTGLFPSIREQAEGRVT